MTVNKVLPEQKTVTFMMPKDYIKAVESHCKKNGIKRKFFFATCVKTQLVELGILSEAEAVNA